MSFTVPESGVYMWNSMMDFLSACGYRIMNVSISVTFLALAVMLFRLVFKKAPKWLNVGLWALVAIRMICPFSLESAMSLIPNAETLPIFEMYSVSSDRIPYASFDIIENPAYSEAIESNVVVEDVENFTTTTIILLMAWFWGAVLMLLYALISYIRLRYTVRTAIPLKEEVWLCDSVKSPFILGVFRPRIYLPSAMDENTAKLVLRHERAHIKRKDHLWKPIGFVLLSFYWFNPVLWLSYILLCRDIELACDEKVIKNMENADKKAYSEALLFCSAPHRMISACPVAFGEVGVKKRIKSVLNYKKPAFWLILIALVVGVVIVLCFMTDPKSENGGVVAYNGVDEISELTFPMEKILSKTESFIIYNGNSTTDDYFEAKSEDVFCFREASAFLTELKLTRIVDGEVDSLTEPQTNAVVELRYSDPMSLRIIFHDNYTKMYMNHSSDGLYARSKDYSVENPDEAEKFFNEKPYMQSSLVWEYNLASSAWGYTQIVLWLDSKYQLNGKIKGDGKISKVTNETTGVDGVCWSPEIVDAPDEYNVEIPVIAEGKEKVFTLTFTKVGKKALSTYYTVRAENLVIAVSEEPYKFIISEPESESDLQWYYNPSLIAEGYKQLSFMLPDGYTLASREVIRNGQADNFSYNAEADITEFKWSPDYDNIMETGKLDMTVTAVKDRETVAYKFTLTPASKDEKGGICFDIEPLNCEITQYKWATYMLDGSVEVQNDTAMFYDLEVGDSFDTELLSELLMTEKATVESGDKTAVVYKCDNILAYLGGTWEFENGLYSHPSGADLAEMKEYSITVAVDKNKTVNVNFNKDCSLMWLTDNKGSYTSTFKVKKPKEIKEFFDDEKFFDESFIWEHNSSVSTYGLSYLRFVVEGEYGSYIATSENGTLRKAEVKKDNISGILQSASTKQITCVKDDNLVWTPDGAAKDTIHIELDGNTSDFYVYVNQLGTNYSGNAIYVITGDYANVMKVKQGSNTAFKFEQSYDVIWSYNPMAGGTWWYQTKYILPEGYEIKSAEATSGEATIEDRLYNDHDGEKLVCWSPDHSSPGNSVLTVVGEKNGKEKEFIIHMNYQGDKNDTGRMIYIISPANCKMKQESIATFLVEEM